MSAEYEQAPIPGRKRGRWTALVEALIAAEGKALVVRDPEFQTVNSINRQCRDRGFLPHNQRQLDGSRLVWVVRAVAP